MAFEPSDFEELVRFLDAHPDMRDQLRRRILSDDFLRLPLDVHDLGEGIDELRLAIERIDGALARMAEAQERTDHTLARMAEAQERTDQTLSVLTLRLDALAEAQERTDQALTRLVEALGRTDANLQRQTLRIDSLAGRALEAQFRERAQSYFGMFLKRPRLVEPDDLEGIDAALESGVITEYEFDSLRWLDGIIRGRDKRETGGPESLLALEVSLTIHTDDVERASERAAVLRKAGYRAFGVVGGEAITPVAAQMAERAGVLIRFASPDGMPREQTA